MQAMYLQKVLRGVRIRLITVKFFSLHCTQAHKIVSNVLISQ